MARNFKHRFLRPSRALIACGLTLAHGQFTSAADAPASSVKRTSQERYQLEHLQKTHEDAEKVRASRKDLKLPESWRDIRAIFHAHAEDSEHTGGTRPEMIAEARKAGVNVLFLSDHYRPRATLSRLNVRVWSMAFCSSPALKCTVFCSIPPSR